jgi:hypothetical protein
LVTEQEWAFLSRNYDFDKAISVVKIPKESQHQLSSSSSASKQIDDSTSTQANSQSKSFYYLFEPEVCQICIKMNELTKLVFENKKIFIRQIDEDNPTTVPIDIQAASTNYSSVNSNNLLNNATNNEDSEVFPVNNLLRLFV